MVRRWTSDVRVEWKPSLTFNMRRIALAEWLDERIHPVALLDEPDQLGVAVGSVDVRVTIRRQSMVASAGALGGDLTGLSTVIQGVFEVLEPRDAVVARVGTLCTEVVPESSYNDATAYFARHVAASGATLAGLVPADASALMDLDAPDQHVQVEWGVVDRDELLFRLANPQVGRIQGSPRSRLVDQATIEARWHKDLPEVALLADITQVRKRGGKVSSASDVLHLTKGLTESAEGIAQALHQSLWPRRRTERELA